MENKAKYEMTESTALRNEAKKEITTILLRYAQNLQYEISALENITGDIMISGGGMTYLRELEIKEMLRTEIKKCQVDAEYYQNVAKFVGINEQKD